MSILIISLFLQPLETLPEEDKALIEEMKKEAMGREMGEGAGDEGALMVMSTMNDEGVVAVKNAACERLLQVGVQGIEMFWENLMVWANCRVCTWLWTDNSEGGRGPIWTTVAHDTCALFPSKPPVSGVPIGEQVKS
jgi:hypothetical protein